MKAATLCRGCQYASNIISIHAAREGGDVTASGITGVTTISIHAAREGGDFLVEQGEFSDGISIHAAREGGDEAFDGHVRIEVLFQSTPPVKAATRQPRPLQGLRAFQSTPPVKAATPILVSISNMLLISIHAAREGGD